MNTKYKLIQSSYESDSFRQEEIHSKYKHVWQSARMKLKFRLVLQKMIKVSILMNEPQKIRNSTGTQLLRNESTIQIEKNFWVFHPDSLFVRIWNLLIGLLIFQSAIVMPIFLAFPLDGEIDIVDLFDKICTLIYLLDFLISCNLGFIDENKTLITNRKLITLRYLKSWMIIDILSFFPFDLFVGSNLHFNPLVKLVRVPRLYKLLKISKAFKWMKYRNNHLLLFRMMDLFNIRYSTLRTFITVTTILAMIHIVSCLWCFVGLASQTSDSWVLRNDLQDASDFTLYLSGFYWATTTYSTVGYGDISAGNDLERVLSVIWMIFCTFFLGITVATLSSFLSGLDSKENLLLNKLAVIDEFSVQTGLKKTFRLKLRNSIRRNSTISAVGFVEKKEIIKELPKNLQFELALNMHRGAAKSLTFFRDKEDFVICAIVPYLTPVYVQQDNYVYREGTLADEIYFLVKGKVMYIEPMHGLTIYANKKKDYFGDIEVFNQGLRIFHAKSQENSELLLFSSQLMKKIKRDHPNLWNELLNVATAREKTMEKNVKRVKKLDKIRRTYPSSQTQAIRFQTYQKIKRDMKKCLSNENFGSKKVVDEANVLEQLDILNESLLSLQGKIFVFSSNHKKF